MQLIRNPTEIGTNKCVPYRIGGVPYRIIGDITIQQINHIYIHFPFCIKKCGYCSFYSEIYNSSAVELYINNLEQEIDYYKSRYDIQPTTIYFGGGTPSLLLPSQIHRILKKFNLTKIEEITLEANPKTIDINKLREYRDIGIDRLSLGVQSFNDNDLQLLGRVHSANDVYQLYNAGINNIFDNISIDIIYGFGDFKLFNTLNSAHISIYCLTLEADTALYSQRHILHDDDKTADTYYNIIEYLKSEGFHQYELSSFAKNGKVSKHNLAYWSMKYYLGLGPGASGYLDNFRYENPRDLSYNILNYPLQTRKFPETEPLSTYIITGLRKTEGIELTAQLQKIYEKEINNLLKKKLIEVINNDGKIFMKLTKQSYFIANEVLCEFV